MDTLTKRTDRFFSGFLLILSNNVRVALLIHPLRGYYESSISVCSDYLTFFRGTKVPGHLKTVWRFYLTNYNDLSTGVHKSFSTISHKQSYTKSRYLLNNSSVLGPCMKLIKFLPPPSH